MLSTRAVRRQGCRYFAPAVDFDIPVLWADIPAITYFFCCDTVTVCPAIVSVPVRAAPLFAATENVTVPLPLRLESLVTVIHGALLTAVHVQPDVVVTVTGSPFPPALPMVSLKGAMAYMHPACVTVTVCTTTVRVPLRAGPVLFGAMLYEKVPSPVPLLPLTTMIHDVSLLADHWQPVAVVTPMELELTPEAEAEMLCGINVYVHPACVTVTVFPATVNVPMRATLLFVGTLKRTLPLPLPFDPNAIEIQLALLAAVQMQSPGDVTASEEFDAPDLGSETLVGITEASAHGEAA